RFHLLLRVPGGTLVLCSKHRRQRPGMVHILTTLSCRDAPLALRQRSRHTPRGEPTSMSTSRAFLSASRLAAGLAATLLLAACGGDRPAAADASRDAAAATEAGAID